MKKSKFLWVWLALSLFVAASAVSCDDTSANGDGNGNGNGGGGNETPIPVPDPDPEAEGIDVTMLDGYPAGMKVFKFAEQLEEGKECSGYGAVVNFAANPKLRFNAAIADGKMQKPSQIHAEYADKGRGKPLVTINAGYFVFGGRSLSLLYTGGVMKSIAVQRDAIPKTDDHPAIPFYPVRSAFGLTQSGNYEFRWIYCAADDMNRPYRFPSALDNDERTLTFMPSPPTSETEGAKRWYVTEAVSAGPRLLQGGVDVSTENYWKEVFHAGGVGGLARHPRTAIGLTEDQKIIILVCDGRTMNGSSGYTFKELASALKRFGAVDAMNLDGGGSSTFVGVDGKVLNRPSDTKDGDVIVERGIWTAVVITEGE